MAIIRRAIWDFVLYKDEDPTRFDPEKFKSAKAKKRAENERKRAERNLAIATDAAGWLFWDGEEETDEEGRYTFKYICSILNLDPTEVRQRALSMTREDIQVLNNHIKED
jgi:hypothetical protein